MTPVGVFFIYPNEDKLGFVNSAKVSQGLGNKKRPYGVMPHKRMK